MNVCGLCANFLCGLCVKPVTNPVYYYPEVSLLSVCFVADIEFPDSSWPPISSLLCPRLSSSAVTSRKAEESFLSSHFYLLCFRVDLVLCLLSCPLLLSPLCLSWPDLADLFADPCF